MTTYIYKDELYHHGIKGQRWGIRRFQNEDGTYTEEGKKRYEITVQERRGLKDKRLVNNYNFHNSAVNYYNSKVPKGNSLKKAYNMSKAAEHMRARDSLSKQIEKRNKKLEDDAYNRMSKTRDKFMKKYGNCEVSYNVMNGSYTIRADGPNKSDKKELAKKVAIGTAIVGGTILAAYGAKRISDLRTNDKATETLIKNLTKTSAKLKEENSFWDKEANRTAHEYYKLSSDKNLGKKVSDDDISSARKRAQDSHFALSNVWDKQRDVERALSTAKWARKTNPYSRVKDKIKKRG